MRKLLSFCLLFIILLSPFLFLACRGKNKKISSPPKSDKMVFISEKGICTISPEGKNLKVIVPSNETMRFTNPLWSPGREKIGFTGYIQKRANVMMVDTDGSHLDTLTREIPPELKEEQPGRVGFGKAKMDWYFRGFTFDGNKVLSTNGSFDQSRIGMVDFQGKLTGVLKGNFPSLLGENKITYLAYSMGEGGMVTDVFYFDLKEKKNFSLTDDPKIEYYLPVGSPRGDKVVYGFNPGQRKDELWILNVDRTEKKKIATRDVDFFGAPIRVIKFSPDGDKLLFLPENGDQSEIYVVNVDGTNLKGITGKIAKGSGGACWSPDGKKIVFTSFRDGNDELYIINSDGTGLKRLTNNDFMDCCPAW